MSKQLRETLPSSLDFLSEELTNVARDAVTYNQKVIPISGTGTYGEAQNIDFVLPQQDYMHGATLMYNATYKITKGLVADVAFMLGCPAYTPISRVSTKLGQLQDDMLFYNIIQNQINTIAKSQDQLFSGEACFGFSQGVNSAIGTAIANNDLDKGVCNGRLFDNTGAVSDTFSISVPLNIPLSHWNKYIPLGKCPQIQIQLTTDVIANMFGLTGYAVPASFSMSNVFLSYDAFKIPPSAEATLYSEKAPVIRFKSLGFQMNALPLAVGATGLNTLAFSVGKTYLKAVVASFSVLATNAVEVCGQYDSIDPSRGSSGSSFQLTVGGQLYPRNFLSTSSNPCQILNQLRKVSNVFWSPYYHSTLDYGTNLNISTAEFLPFASATAFTAVTGPQRSAKFLVGFPTERTLFHSQNSVSGVPSGTQVVLDVNVGSIALPLAMSARILSIYDVLYDLDLTTQTITKIE
jgi:hypothetical protein